MAGGPHLYRVEAGFAEHLAEALGVVPPGPEAEYTEEMTDSLSRRGPEVNGHETTS